MQANASKLELDLMPDHRVVITLRCDTAVLYEDICETARAGTLHLDFVVEKARVVIDRTKDR
jgi:hypothetical protein